MIDRMYIATIDFTTSPADRDTVIGHLESGREMVLAMPGCQRFTAFPHPTDPTAVTILHAWDDEADLAAYLASEAFATFGRAARPLMTSPPTSRRYRAELVETVV